MRGSWPVRSVIRLALLALVMSACAIDAAELPATPSPVATAASPAPETAAPSAPAGVPTEAPSAAPTYSKLRVFVASENTEQVWVLEGTPKGQFALVGKIGVGKLPHQMAVSPDGRFVAVNNRLADSTSIIDPVAMKEIEFIPTGRGAHGLQVSRDTKSLYVSNRLEGSVSVIDFASRSMVAKWHIPGGGSPDMLQLNPQGTQLWASGRYNRTVYVFDTLTGEVIARIAVGSEDHGLTYFPNVGRYSLGHNGVYR